MKPPGITAGDSSIAGVSKAVSTTVEAKSRLLPKDPPSNESAETGPSEEKEPEDPKAEDSVENEAVELVLTDVSVSILVPLSNRFSIPKLIRICNYYFFTILV